MIDKNKCCLMWILLLHWHSSGGTAAQQPAQFNPYANSRRFPQLEHHLFDAVTHNNFAQNTHQLPHSPQYPNQEFVPVLPPSYADQRQFYQYPSQFSSSTAIPTSTPTQLWSGPPIVVGGDDYTPSPSPSSYSNVNTGQLQHSDNRALLSMHRSPKELPAYGTRQVPQHRPLQVQPSDFNYGNQVIYHSDVRRHQINASPDESKQQDFTIYNPPEQHQTQYLAPEQQPQHPQHTQHQPPQLYASNTDLNYLRAVAGYNTDKGHSYAGGQTAKADDYAEHFKEYLRKYPRRIRPIY